jgi:hypothetical protein
MTCTSESSLSNREPDVKLAEKVRREERLLEALRRLEDRLDAIRLDHRLRQIDEY